MIATCGLGSCDLTCDNPPTQNRLGSIERNLKLGKISRQRALRSMSGRAQQRINLKPLSGRVRVGALWVGRRSVACDRWWHPGGPERFLQNGIREGCSNHHGAVTVPTFPVQEGGSNIWSGLAPKKIQEWPNNLPKIFFGTKKIQEWPNSLPKIFFGKEVIENEFSKILRILEEIPRNPRNSPKCPRNAPPNSPKFPEISPKSFCTLKSCFWAKKSKK